MRHYRLALALSIAMGLTYMAPVAVMAEGPGDALEQAVEETTAEAQETVQDPNDISLKESSNPVVKPVAIYTYDQMAQDISALQTRYSGKMRVGSFGTSLDGRTLYEVTIGNPNAGKHVMIQAGIHGREYMTPLLVMKQLETALEFYDTANYKGEPLRNMLDQVQVHFLPMVNPDGVCISQMGLGGLHSYDLRQIMEKGYQKDIEEERTDTTLDKYVLYCKGNGRGVDLNVNFPANWEAITTSPGHASYTGYKGESPASEPETKGLMELAGKYHWSATVSYHSQGEVIYWDYPQNKVREESKALAEALGQLSGYTLLGSDGKGGFKDWMQIKDDPAPSVTVETGSAECPMPFSQWENVWSKNRSGWAAALHFAWSNE